MVFDSRRSDTLSANITSRGVRGVLRWLRIGAWEAEALESREDVWGLYVEDAEPGENGAWHGKFWCGSWIWNHHCRMGQHCKFMHPEVKLKLCHAKVSGNVNGKMIPARRVNLQEACHIAPERIIFVEHAEAGIVWGRIFNLPTNRKLMAAFLQSPWFAQAFPNARVQPSVSEEHPACFIPDNCWHQVAAAAGLRGLLKLQLALGKGVQWAPWFQRFSSEKRQESRYLKLAEGKPIDWVDYTLETSKNGRARCAECLQWHGCDPTDRCKDCRRFLCRACCTIHICQHSVQLRDAQGINANECSETERMGSLIRAAAECTAIASALRARNPKYHRPAGGAQWSELVEHCRHEEPRLLPSRVLDCGSEVLSACYSSALLAVRTTQQVRVIRRDDWKTLLSMPAPLAQSGDLGLEVLEGRSLLITTAKNGLSVLKLDTLKSTVVHTQGDEWTLRALDKGLLTANAGAASLRDLERPNLPLIAMWRCHPLSFGSTGAIVVSPESKNNAGQSVQWLDPRQSELVALNLFGECKDEFDWTAAAIAPGGGEHLVVLGSRSGRLVAADLRQPKMPLWSIQHMGHGAVGRIHASDRLLLADSHLALDAGFDKLTQAVTWQGRSLAVFKGMHVVGTPSGPAPGPQPQSLLACGIGNSVLVVGAAPPVAKERIVRCDDVPRNGHKSKLWERGTRHSNNRRT